MAVTLAQTAGLFTNGALAAAGAAAVSIPIIIHLLTRMRRRPQRWGAMKFLLEAFRRHRRRLRLEQWLLLLVRCLILLVLGLALAGPMLGGCARKLGMDTTGRLICIVIDDSLAGHTVADANAGAAQQRFDRQRDMALKLIDGLDPADRVAVWRAARPVDALVGSPSQERVTLRRAVENLEPRYSRADLTGALRQVKDLLVEQDVPADRAFVFVLSDFARDALPVDRPLPSDLSDFGDLARVLVTRPAPSAANAQIATLAPRRYMIVTGADEGAVRIPIELRIDRFGDGGAGGTAAIDLALMTGDLSKPLATWREQYRWSGDDQPASMKRDLLLPREALDALSGGAPGAAQGRGSSITVVLRARIEPDALEADNERWAVLELRRQHRVAVIGDVNRGLAQEGFTPSQYVSYALAPLRDRAGSVELVPLAAVDVDERKVAALDAAFVMRPDLLSDAGWRGLAHLASRGGLVWLFAPQPGGPATWAETLASRFGVRWQLGLDPKTVGVAAGDDNAANNANRTPGIGLAIDRPEPEPFTPIANDWKDLLRPIRVFKRYALSVPGGGSDVWLWTEDGQPLLASARVGDGYLLLLAASANPAWTNLITKPLWSHLLHEPLNSALAQTVEAARLAGVVAGDQPTMGGAWDGVAQLERVGGPGAGGADGDSASDNANRVLLRRGDEGFAPIGALERPGVYRAAPEARGRLIAVNIDGPAGDTRALDPDRLEAWLGEMGQVNWLEGDDALAALALFSSRANIGQLLLWMTLAFVLVEVFLARWFSHGHRDGARSMVGVGAMLFNRFVGRSTQPTQPTQAAAGAQGAEANGGRS